MVSTPQKTERFKSGPRPLGGIEWTFWGHFGPVLTRFQLFWPIVAPFLPPGLETGMESSMGPKPVKTDFFQKWTQTLQEGQTDLSGPFRARFDQFSGCTGYRIPDTATPGSLPLYSSTRDGQSPTWAQNQSKGTYFRSGPGPFGSVKRT